MANILLLDGNEVAGRAMQGILARGYHTCYAAQTSADAWTLLHDLVKIDLLIVELELKGENGFSFIQRIREDCLVRQLPIVVYTGVSEHGVVKKVLGLRVQNYLIKPYNDEAIYREITKAGVNSWRNLHFEEEKSFCAQMGLQVEELRKMREELLAALDRSRGFFATCADHPNPALVSARVTALADKAEAAGFWGAVDLLNDIRTRAESGDWKAFKKFDENLVFAGKLIFDHLNPNFVATNEESEAERMARHDAAARALWFNADVDKSGSMVTEEEVLLQVDTLTACPVIDTVAAAFQMTNDRGVTSLNQVNDLVAKDPALTANVLIAANRLERTEVTVIDDPRAAVGLLGNLRLASLAKSLPVVLERHMNVPPISWAQFWMFQAGVARLSQFTCQQCEFGLALPLAYTAGLMHDIGKLLLVRLFPFGFPAMVAYANDRAVSLPEAERKYLGVDARGMADRFVRRIGLPLPFCNVIRWVETPEEATADVELVSAVALARILCLHNHVGFCGDTVRDAVPPIEETSAWRALRGRVFPSFNLRQFETQAHALCQELRQTLIGRET